MNDFGRPGIGGSLGQCALCGNTFLNQILTGETIKPFRVNGSPNQLYAHKACLKKYKGKEWKDLPAASPLRQAFENQIPKEVQP